MSAPIYTTGAAGNASASAALAAGTSRPAFTVDLTAAYEGVLQFGATFGTIAVTAGLQVSIYPVVGSTPVADTVAGAGSFTLAAVAGAQARTVRLQQGKYSIVLTNLDATNGLTAVYCSDDTET
ncbi:MAG: hypothetical protein LC745_03680 [Planctomycetia bacterium]|nr:hypothetical protein [Planctomycetia bacterium]